MPSVFPAPFGLAPFGYVIFGIIILVGGWLFLMTYGFWVALFKLMMDIVILPYNLLFGRKKKKQIMNLKSSGKSVLSKRNIKFLKSR